MAQVTIRLMGSPQIERDGARVTLETRKALALLAYLITSGQRQRRSTLAALLWPESDQQRARTSLRRTLAALKKSLGREWISADRSSIGFEPEGDGSGDLWVDLLQFQSHRACGPAHGGDSPCPSCLDRWGEAVSLYRAPFMAGFSLTDSAAFDDWLSIEAETLQQEVTDLLARLVAGERERGEIASAIAHARHWITLEPLHEPAHRALIRLYAELGERGAALRQYQECVRLLKEEFDVEPEPETTALHALIAHGGVERERPRPVAPPPAAPPPAVPAHNLPARATSFVGRQEERQTLHRLLDDPGCRLVTLVGPGGIGKTRLATEVGHDRLEKHAHGVYLVMLGEVSTPSLFLPAIADAIGFSFYAGAGQTERIAQLTEYLSARELLLILDNFEQLLEQASLVGEILRGAPGVKVLATSQERLNLREEWVVELFGLQYPNGNPTVEVEQSSAVQLFLQRAHQVRQDFLLSEADRPHVARICQLVDGMPLGIELASSWVRMLSCREIAGQIEHSLDFLATRLRDVPERHRSLRAVFERSWQMLEPEAQAVLGRLAIFRGGFQAAAAGEVAGAELLMLMTLSDKSLVRREAQGRYAVPEVLRQYALAKLPEAATETLAGQHAHYFARFLIEREADLKGRRQQAALDELRADHVNMRAALRTLVSTGQAGQLAAALDSYFIYYDTQGLYEEGAAECGRAAAHFVQLGLGSEPLVARLIAARGAFLGRMSRFTEARADLDQALALLRHSDEPSSLAFALAHLGVVAVAVGDAAAATAHLEESLAHYERAGDEWGMGNVLNALGNVHQAIHHHDIARRLYQESLGIRRRIEDQRGIALCYHNLGNIADALGAVDEAKSLYLESLSIKRALGDRRGVAYSLNNLGYLTCMTGAYPEAERYLAESLAILRDLGDRRGMAYALMNLGNVALGEKEYGLARRRYDESWTHFDQIGDPIGIAYSVEDRANVAMQFDEIESAGRLYREALRRAHALSLLPVQEGALLGLAAAEARAGRQLSALRILGALLDDGPLSEPGAQRAGALWERLSDGVERPRAAAARADGASHGLVATIADLLDGFYPL